jgi:hypothetical protein
MSCRTSGVDWMWLEHGYEPEDLRVIDDGKRIGVSDCD